MHPMDCLELLLFVWCDEKHKIMMDNSNILLFLSKSLYLNSHISFECNLKVSECEGLRIWGHLRKLSITFVCLV